MPKVDVCRRGRWSTLVAVAALSSIASGNSLAITAAEAARARWAAKVNLSLVPVAGAVRADGKVVFWSAENRLTFAGGSNTYTTLFDPATNTAVERNVTETGHNMFCPGTARLPDGRLIVNGGLSAGNTSIYDPSANTWTRGPTMNIARGYNANTPLWDGSVMTLGGSWNGGTAGGKTAEIYSTATNSWRLLSGVPYDPYLLDGVYNGWQTDSHPALISTANGRVLMAGPAVNMAWIDTRGNGSSTPAGRRGDDTPSLGGNWVMYEPGRILKLGGATWNGNTPANANTYVIDTTAGTANVRKLAPMAYPRMYPNSVVLPNGHVVVVGGQTFVQEFSDSNAVLAAELWDPATETFAVLPSMSVARNYHSIALLLPDGRVVSAGGGLCGCAADHPDLQILSPPYLFNADGSAATRPAITSAPTTVGYGTTATVVTNTPVSAFSLVRLGAVTHTVNNDQRRVPLSFTGGTNNSYTLSIPTNPGILLPGQWMLFAMNANGTPSVATIVTVSNSGAPVLQNPGDLNATVGQAVNLPLTASTPSGTLGFSATGLPAGLTINATNGTISGTPTTAGTSLVTIRAANGTRTVSTDIVISASTVGTGTGLLGQYFANRDLGGAVALQRIEVPNFDGATAAPGTGVPADGFSARWSGSIEPSASGATQIRTNSDDGVRVWIDNRLVIDNWTDHAPTLNTAAINMVAGQRYPILIEYYEGGGPGSMQLQWQPPGATAFATVPTTRLYPATAPSTVNLASGRTATQASLFESAAASRAVDGNTNGTYGSGSVTHTNGGAQDWWQVDLGRLSRIDLVQLWNRTDCCSERLNNFVLFVSSTDMTGRTLDQLNADPAIIKRAVGVSRVIANIGIPVGANGRYVRVQLTGTNFLSLAEVQVFGAAAFGTPTISTIAAQQNIVGTSVAVQAAASDPDGNTLTYGATGLPAGVTINSTTGLISGTPSAAGTFSVTVTAQNAGGLSASTAFTWTVLGAIPQVTSLPAPVASSGSTVTYTPVLSGGATSQYSWNFGDGTADTAFSNTSSVTHAFAAPGVYTVTLTIRTSDGRTSTYRMVQAINAGGTTALSRASSALMLEPRAAASTRLWVVNPDNDSVSVFDTANNARLAEINVGTGPRTVALASDGRIWVVNKQSASISIISPSSLGIVQTINAPRASQPYGIVFSPSDGSAFVALEATGQVLKLNGSSGATIGSLSVGNNPRHLAINAAGNQLFVSRFITRPLPGEATATVATTDAGGARVGGEVIVVDPSAMSITRTLVLGHSDRTDNEVQGRGFPNYLGAVAISPDARSAWVPSKQDNLRRGTLRDGQALDFQNTVRAVSSRIDLTSNAEDLAGRVDHDNASVASAAVYHPNGVYLFVALETSRQVAVVDAAGKRELFRYEVGLAPQGLVVSSDGSRLYVGNFMSRTVSAIDLQPLVASGLTTAPTIATLATIGTEKLAATILRGKQLFYDARDTRLARDAYMSCATCHNDGGQDGRVWDLTGQAEGLRNTINLRGRAGMGNGFLHWSANFDEVQDFEAQIRNLAGGTGLMSNADFTAGTRFQPLGDRKAGLSADLDALAAYVASLATYDRSPFGNSDGSLTTAAQAGRNVFVAGNCASCHSGANFTGSADATQLKNIGSIKASSGSRLGAPLTGIDIPTLLDVWGTAPYLHDGSAATLGAAVSAHNGVTLSATDLASLVEYLQQVGSAGSSVIVRARANLAGGIGANIELRLNGSVVGTAIVNATAFQDYAFTIPAVLAGDRIDVVFNNDASTPEDRNLYVESVKIDSTTILPTTAGVTIDRGLDAAAFDGVDVIAGQVGIFWNAALRMTMPGTPPADNVAPTVSITAPAAGASVSGSVTVTADAADNTGVAGVQFLLDGVALGAEDTTAPYSVTWNSATASAGAHTLTARARDAANNQSTSTAINVSVAASGSTTITVRARANLSGGVGANIELRVNGVVVGTTVVNATTYTDYLFNVATVNAGSQIDVVFTNDAATPEDRNLYVESVKVGATTILSTAAGVTVDKGSGTAAFDGLDVIPGQAGIFWNAALRMVAP